MSYTPGPWSVSKWANGEISVDANKRFGKIVGIVRVLCALGPENQRANAALIAAAPEMLKALHALLASTDLNLDELGPTTLKALELAHAVIAKAEGRDK